MKLDLTALLFNLSYGLDEVEKEFGGMSLHHGKHCGFLCYLMGRACGMENEELRDLIGCAIMHDNALTEYLREEYGFGGQGDEKRKNDIEAFQKFTRQTLHSIVGEQNLALIPFRTDLKNVILYHHENDDGSGVMGKSGDEIPFKAQLIHVADLVDITANFFEYTEEEFRALQETIKEQAGKAFSQRAADAFISGVRYEDIREARDIGIREYMKSHLGFCQIDYSRKEIFDLALFFTRIIDCKSSYTMDHSLGVTQKLITLCDYYGLREEPATRIFFAGALHDIGKLAVTSNILDSAKTLSDDEMTNMKNHAKATYLMLSDLPGLEDVRDWASNHHEKLDGSGYPRGLTAEKLTREDRMIACIDIYEALVEERPYKRALTHEETIRIMDAMVRHGEIDGEIVRDIDACFRNR